VTDDYFHLVLAYPQTAVILHAGSLVREPPPHFQLHGSKGSFIKYGLDSQEDALKAGKRPGDPGWGQDEARFYGELTTDLGELTIRSKVTTLPGHYEAFYQGMAEAIMQGKPAPVAPEDARKTILAIECALRSHREQRAKMSGGHFIAFQGGGAKSIT
jgi:scyllo-inositol 2-dehydrogenase (NADP+)